MKQDRQKQQPAQYPSLQGTGGGGRGGRKDKKNHRKGEHAGEAVGVEREAIKLTNTEKEECGGQGWEKAETSDFDSHAGPKNASADTPFFSCLALMCLAHPTYLFFFLLLPVCLSVPRTS